MATLSVQEAMGFKVDREAVATLVLPQLWTMSMGPCMLSILLSLLRLITPHSSTERRTISTLYVRNQETW